MLCFQAQRESQQPSRPENEQASQIPSLRRELQNRDLKVAEQTEQIEALRQRRSAAEQHRLELETELEKSRLESTPTANQTSHNRTMKLVLEDLEREKAENKRLRQEIFGLLEDD